MPRSTNPPTMKMEPLTWTCVRLPPGVSLLLNLNNYLFLFRDCCWLDIAGNRAVTRFAHNAFGENLWGRFCVRGAIARHLTVAHV